MRTPTTIAERLLALVAACTAMFAAVAINAIVWQYTRVQAIPLSFLLGVIAFALTLRYRTVWMSAAWAVVPIGFVLPSIVYYLRDDTLGTHTAAWAMADAGIQALLMIGLGTVAAVFWSRRRDGDLPSKAQAR